MTTRLYVGNIPFDLNEEFLKELFDSVGIVESVKLIKDRQSGRSKGYGFVEMSTDEEANTAVEKLNGFIVEGRNLKVSLANARERKSTGSILTRRSLGGYGKSRNL